jgi:hypothetical protein
LKADRRVDDWAVTTGARKAPVLVVASARQKAVGMGRLWAVSKAGSKADKRAGSKGRQRAASMVSYWAGGWVLLSV